MYDAAGVLTAVIVHAGRLPSDGALREVTGSRQVLPLRADRVNAATGYAAELVAPLALPDSIEVYADEDVVCGIDRDVVVYTATGESRTALGIRLLDLFTLLDAKPAALTRPTSLMGRGHRGASGPAEPSSGRPRAWASTRPNEHGA